MEPLPGAEGTEPLPGAEPLLALLVTDALPATLDPTVRRPSEGVRSRVRRRVGVSTPTTTERTLGLQLVASEPRGSRSWRSRPPYGAGVMAPKLCGVLATACPS